MLRAGGEVDGLLRLYPAAWRERYADEVVALLAELPATRAVRLDLLRGAVDAHLHPPRPLGWPAVAASVGGIAWTFAAAFVLGQPVQPDWPGYLVETLPIQAAAVPLLTLAAVGATTRLGDQDPRAARTGRRIVVAGGVAWSLLLVLALAGVAAGWLLAAGSSILAVGLALIAIALVNAADHPLAELLLLTALALVLPLPWASLAFGAGWAGAAAVELWLPRPLPARPGPG